MVSLSSYSAESTEGPTEDDKLWANENQGEGVSTEEETWEEAWDDDGMGTDDTEDLWSAEDTTRDDYDEGWLKFSGKIWNKLAHDVREENSYESDLFNHFKLKAGATMVQSDQLYAVLFIDADYFSYGNNGDYNDDTTLRLGDAYVNLRENWFNLRLGNQIIKWGKTDALSPLDNLNPEDLRDNLAGRREERKLSIPMANLELYKGNITLSGVYIPFFVESEYDLTGTDWAIFDHVEGLTFIEEGPSQSLNNSEGGVRVSGALAKMDWALSWLHAREDLPTPDTLALPSGMVLPPGNWTVSDLADFANGTGQQVYLTHDKQNIYGFEFETTLSSLGVRGDLAFRDDASFFTRELEQIKKPVVQAMAGVDYSGENNWYANTQLFMSHVQDYEDRIVWAKETTWALNGTLWKEFSNGKVKLECLYYYDLSGDATVFHPKVRLSYWEPIVFEFGGEWFDGSTETQIGRWSDNDQIYAVLEIQF